MAEDLADLGRLLPPAPGPWRIIETDQRFGRENLYNYIDGGAELYLSYGFQEMVNRTYSAAGQPDIILDIFDMGSSRDAFGVFSQARETVASSFGQGSQYTAGLLLFWKDRYYVSILASPETAESEAAVFRLARTIDKSIPARGPLPRILQRLPEKNLIRASIRYFHHYIWLNSFYFISDRNLLHIAPDTDAVLAKYETVPRRSLLLLIGYPTEQRADSAFCEFKSAYLPDIGTAPAQQMTDHTWTAARRDGKLVRIVFNAPAEETALKLLSAVKVR